MRWRFSFSHKKRAPRLEPSVNNHGPESSAMNYYSYSAQEPQVEYYPSFSIDNYDTVSTYEEPPSFFDAIFSSSYGNKEVGFASSHQSNVEPSEEAYNEGEELPNNGQEETNWLSEYCSSLGDNHGLFYGHTDDNGHGRDDDQFKDNNYVCYPQHVEDLLLYEGVPWSHHGSWLGYGGEEDFDDYGRQETRPTYSYSLDEMGIFQSLFGYWS